MNENTMKQQMGTRLSELRDAHKLSQQELADMLGVSRGFLSMVEGGQRDLRSIHLMALLSSFGITLEEFISGKNGTKPNLAVGLNEQKFRRLLLYILNRVGQKPNVGETVLYKLLYYIEKAFYINREYKKQLVGLTFIKRPFGPVPAGFKALADKMIEENLISRVNAKFHDKLQKKYLPNIPIDENAFTTSEKNIIDKVLKDYSDYTATEITNLSHKEPAWLNTEDNQFMNFDLVRSK